MTISLLLVALTIQQPQNLPGEIGENLRNLPFLELSSTKPIGDLQLCAADAVSKELTSSFITQGDGSVYMITHQPWIGYTAVPLIIKFTRTDSITKLTMTSSRKFKGKSIDNINACL